MLAMHPSISITVGSLTLETNYLGLQYPSQPQLRPAITIYIVKLNLSLSRKIRRPVEEMRFKLADKIGNSNI